jgi:phasin family protein
MTTKTKTAGEKTAASAESAIETGAAALKTGFDKAAKNYDAALSFGKDTAEAYVKSATVAQQGAETIGTEIYAYSKQSIEDSIVAGKAILGAKSIHEAFEVQTDFAKSAFEAYVGQLSKFSELFTATSKDAFAPLKGRAQAWAEVVQTARVA